MRIGRTCLNLELFGIKHLPARHFAVTNDCSVRGYATSAA